MNYGLIGARLSYSFSKEIHAAIGGYEYELKEVKEEEFADFMRRADFKGINVTIPYKEKVMPFLDFVSDEAKKIGSVNTVVKKDGKLYGYNTDYFGLKSLILKSGADVAGKKALVLGGGGTYKTARAVLTDLGASEIIKVGRNAANSDATYGELAEKHADASVAVNATPVGTFPDEDGTLLDFDELPNIGCFIDAVYNPLRSASVVEAESRGKIAAGGLYMLVSQAVKAAALFTGKEVGDADAIFADLLADKENIVLIGMPSAGKTTVGKILAQMTGKRFCDSDEEIEKIIKTTIPEYFANCGEEAFRKTESEVISRLSLENSLVIATGGGAVLRDENIKRLKRNGRIYFIDRNKEDLVPTADRPTANSREAVYKRYEERYGKYLSAADVRIEVNCGAEGVAEKIAEEFFAEKGLNFHGEA